MRTKKLRNLKISNKNLNNSKKKILIKKNYQKNIVKIISGSLSPNQIIKEKELYFQTIGNRFKIFLFKIQDYKFNLKAAMFKAFESLSKLL